MFKNLSFNALALCLISKNILSVKTQEISDCSIVREAANELGNDKIKFNSPNCCDLDVVTCNGQNVIGIKFVGISCFGFEGANLEKAIDKIASLTQLESFEISHQSWCGYPKNIQKLGKLKTLILSNNGFDNTLPEDIIQINTLEKLDLSHNRYFNTIPSSYSKLTNLKSLSLNNNNLVGNVPYAFTQLKNLSELNLAENRELTGCIPDFSKVTTCDYKSTDLCILKNVSCTSESIKTCTQQDVDNIEEKEFKDSAQALLKQNSDNIDNESNES
eukprot:jgi/Orpsp1_1/1184734/evm.model.c7180000090767.1